METKLQNLLEKYLSNIEKETKVTLKEIKNDIDLEGSSLWSDQFRMTFFDLVNSRISRTYEEFTNFMVISASSRSLAGSEQYSYEYIEKSESDRSFNHFTTGTSSSTSLDREGDSKSTSSMNLIETDAESFENDGASEADSTTIESVKSEPKTDLSDKIKWPAVKRTKSHELAFQMMPGFRSSSNILYANDEKQFYVRNSALRDGVSFSFICYDAGCTARVHLRHDKCYVANDVPHMHDDKTEMYINLCALNEMKDLLRSGENCLPPRTVFDNVIEKYPESTLLFERHEQNLQYIRNARCIDKEQIPPSTSPQPEENASDKDNDQSQNDVPMVDAEKNNINQKRESRPLTLLND